jgi:ketosteroid isomerase-like protein
MANVSKAFSIVMVIVFVAIFERASQASEFDVGEIRAATSKLVDALGDPDPTAWVYMYTEDAGLLEAGSEPVVGRTELLKMAKSMLPMSSVAISPSYIEGSGTLAYMYGRASWVNGRPPNVGSKSKVHLVIVWRKESDGQWRVAHEALIPEEE